MAFNALINSIAPLPTPLDWVRPPDWITIVDTPNEVQFLVADVSLKCFSIQTQFTRTTGNIYIDWGDGVIDTISTTALTTTEHVYSTGGTPCSRGYNTFKIRIYGDATCVITNVRHTSNFTVTGGSAFYNIGVLEAYFGDGTMDGMAPTLFSSNGGSGSVATFAYLEYVKLPITVSWTSQMEFMFQNCVNLYKVIMPTSASGLTSLAVTFNKCNNLRDITLPTNATAITSLFSTFTDCTNLRTISFPTTLNNCTTFLSAFVNCVSLKNVTLPSIDLCINMVNAFTGSTSLQWVRFTSLPAPTSPGTVVDFQNIMNASPNLQNVYFPATCSSNAVYNLQGIFSSCPHLKNIIFPTNLNASSMLGSFSQSTSLTSVIIQSPMPNLITLNQAFFGCYLLTSITLPATVGPSIDLTNAFNVCRALTSITIPSGWTIGGMQTAFSSCINIKTINLPNNVQNSITTMLGTFGGCSRLETVVMPTSMNACTSFSGAFSNCSSLRSVTFPSSTTSLTTCSSMFNNCSNLTSVTFPTSIGSGTGPNMGGAFTNCVNIETITLPANMGTSPFSSGLFQGCTNLKTITLPTTQMSGLLNLDNMISQCGALTTINNLNRLGSLTATPKLGANPFQNQTYALTSLSFSCPFTSLSLNGISPLQFNKLNSLRLLNSANNQWTGASPQINVSYCDLGIAALDQLFTDLTTIVGKTINITGCTGAAGCNRSIATAKGWTVTG